MYQWLGSIRTPHPPSWTLLVLFVLESHHLSCDVTRYSPQPRAGPGAGIIDICNSRARKTESQLLPSWPPGSPVGAEDGGVKQQLGEGHTLKWHLCVYNRSLLLPGTIIVPAIHYPPSLQNNHPGLQGSQPWHFLGLKKWIPKRWASLPATAGRYRRFLSL